MNVVGHDAIAEDPPSIGMQTAQFINDVIRMVRV